MKSRFLAAQCLLWGETGNSLGNGGLCTWACSLTNVLDPSVPPVLMGSDQQHPWHGYSSCTIVRQPEDSYPELAPMGEKHERYPGETQFGEILGHPERTLS